MDEHIENIIGKMLRGESITISEAEAVFIKEGFTCSTNPDEETGVVYVVCSRRRDRQRTAFPRTNPIPPPAIRDILRVLGYLE